MLYNCWKFFSGIFFPNLCYGCLKPHEWLCGECLGSLKPVNLESRCPHCLQFIDSEETTTCSECLPSFSRRFFCLYHQSLVMDRMLEHCYLGRKRAIQFFVHSIYIYLLVYDLLPQKLIYIQHDRAKEIVRHLSKKVGLSYQGLKLSRTHIERLGRSLDKGDVCVITEAPLSRAQQEIFEKYLPNSTILLSLLLPEDFD